MNTLKYIIQKYKLDLAASSPVEIPNAGRNNLAEWLHELGFKVGVEVGVAAGRYSEILCKANPGMRIYGVDSWSGYPGYYNNTPEEVFRSFYERAVARLSKYPNYSFIKEFSMEAVKRFDENSLDFVYLDANHKNPHITQDITEWYKKLKLGGILAGHDYIKPRDNVFDVIRATNEYTRKNNIKPWFVIGSIAKIPGTIRDSSRSWMWIKS